MTYLPDRLKALMAEKRAEAQADCKANRTAVLRYPDLAAKLTEPPLGYADPAQWNGYIPPAEWDEQINTSPRRRVLVELVTEALTRDERGGPAEQVAR